MNIEYKIKYSNRKSICIVVDRDSSVVVYAPHNTSNELIQKEINKKKFLLYQKINHPQKYVKPKPKKEFVSGESLLFLGHSYYVEIVDNSPYEIHFDNKFYLNKSIKNNVHTLLKNWYKNQAKIIITPKVELFAKNLGVKYNKIKFSDVNYLWGSCTPSNNLNFNWKIIKAPSFVIDYIIVHELAHLLEPNHTPKFWNIVSIQLPHYHKAKDWLKEFGHLLEIDF